jgi:hypothetical protein
MLAAETGRSARLGSIPVLAMAALAALAAAAGAARMSPTLFLGAHGTWALREGGALVRRRTRRSPPAAATDADSLAPAGETGQP